MAAGTLRCGLYLQYIPARDILFTRAWELGEITLNVSLIGFENRNEDNISLHKYVCDFIDATGRF